MPHPKRICYLMAAAVATAAAGCGSTASSSPTSKTLTIQTSVPSSLSPAVAAPPLAVLPAYDPLIYQAANGNLMPDLATSWGFVGKGNTVFQVTLRSGAKFTDGSPLNAQAVVASMRSFLKAPQSGNAGPVASVEPVGANVVQIHYAKPVPDVAAAFSLTQGQSFGLIVGPKGVTNPQSLATQSDGIGPYKIDAAKSVPGVQTTYTPNPLYFNQKAIKYSAVVVKPVTNPTTRLNAVQSGQADYAAGMPNTSVATAKSANLTVPEGTGAIWQLVLEDRTSGPLANQQVRQAINYAIDRAPVAKAVFAGIAQPTSSMGQKGFVGYNASNPDPYTYDQARAKSLLASAGYSHGFTLSVLDAGGIDPNGTFVQAVASQLQAVGITLKLTVMTGPLPQYLGALFSKKYQAVMLPYQAMDIYTMYDQFMAPGTPARAGAPAAPGTPPPTGTPPASGKPGAPSTLGPPPGNPGNVFNIADPTVEALINRAASAPTSAGQAAGLAQVTAQIDTLAWSAPVARVPDITVVRSSVQNVPSSYFGIMLDPFAPVANLAWQG